MYQSGSPPRRCTKDSAPSFSLGITKAEQGHKSRAARPKIPSAPVPAACGIEHGPAGCPACGSRRP